MKTQHYRVKALTMNGENGKIYSAGDIIAADQLPEGHADKMMADGFLEVHEGALPEETGTTTVKYIITAADLERNPSLKENGYGEGDEVELPHPEYAMVDAASLPNNEDGTENAEGKVLVGAAQALDPKGPVFSDLKQSTVDENTANALLTAAQAAGGTGAKPVDPPKPKTTGKK